MNKRVQLTMLALALSAPVAYSQPSITEQPHPQPQAEAQDVAAAMQQLMRPLQNDPQMQIGKLENGLSYIIRKTTEPKGRASLRMYVDTGSLNESPETKGISHFLEHMVFNGSKHFKRGELIPAMQKLGLGFGGDANAYTGLLQTVYMLDLPKLDEETVNFAFTVMRDFADGAELSEEAIDKERGIVISELKSRDSEGYRASMAYLGQILNGTRVTDYMPIGLEEVIRHCPYETIRQYYRDNYVPERMTVVVTGDFDPAQAQAWVQKYFGDMAKKPNPARPAIGTPSDMGPDERLIPNPENALSTIMLTIVDPWEFKADTLQYRVEQLPLQLAIAMLNQRYSTLSREADSPFNNASVSRQDLFRAASTFGMGTTAQPESWKEALTLAENELRRACEYGFSDSELQEVVASLLTVTESAIEGWPTVTCNGLAGSIINALTDQLALTDPTEDMRSLQAGLLVVMQNPDLCRQALAKAYKANQAKLTIMGAIPADATEQSLRETYEKAKQVKLDPPAKEEEIEFAYDKIGEPGKVAEQKYISDIDTTTLTLSNGVKVNLKRMTARKGSIQVDVAVDGGQMSLPPIPGMSQLVGPVMSMSALEAHSLDDLRRLMAGHKVGMDFGMSQTRFSYSGNTNAKDFELQCKLLAACILHPGFRPEGEMLMRRNLDALYNRLETTPEGAYQVNMAKIMFGNDPRFTFPEKEELTAVNTDMVRQAMTPYLKKGAMEVTIVGDFNLEEVIPVVERTFGAMPARNKEFSQPTEMQRTVLFRPWGQRNFIRYKTDVDKTIVSHIIPAGDGMDRKRARRLGVLVAIAREKVFDGIRAAMGESYSPSVSLELNDDYHNAAFIMASSVGVKRNRVKVNTAMDLILQDLGKGNISAEDFDRAIKPLISKTDKAFTLPSFWSGALGDLQSDPEQLQQIRELRQDIASITLEEIQQLAKETFGCGKVNYFFTVPEDYKESDDTTEETPKDEPSAVPAAALSYDVKAYSVSHADRVSPYTVIISEKTAAVRAWKKVAHALAAKYKGGSKVIVVKDLSEASCAKALRDTQARYAAFVARPEELTYKTVNNFHRAARTVDDDPYGDCIWGIVTGYDAESALRVAMAKKPLVIKRVLGSTNVSHERFDRNFCLTDWGPDSPVLEQTGNVEPTKTTYDASTEKGRFIMQDGLVSLFANELATGKPQLVVSSSHATQFNLEMPYGKGLIFPANNRFYQANIKNMRPVVSGGIFAALQGNTRALATMAAKLNCPEIKPDREPRVWLAAGNCLFGDARGTNQSMAVTALSAYTCNQVVGYTVPSWYGKGGWGTLSMFFDNSAGTTLAEAWFLNNQFILNETINMGPELLKARFDAPEMNYTLQREIIRSGFAMNQANAKEAMGLVHDRDVVAFYGDPAWSATLNEEHTPSPYTVTWQNPKSFTIKANTDRKGRCAVWFPSAETGRGAKGCDAANAVFTNDFILFPELEMKKGETLTVTIK